MLLKKIVIAEDDDSIAHMVQMALGDAGFLCLRARDGDEALKLVRVHSPDLIVLDVMMPRLDGHEVARRVKADVILSKIPILMLTALTDVDKKVEGFDAGADDYLTKPFDLREFNARVHALIRSARREGDRNPTSNLPGSVAIEDRIDVALKEGSSAVLHFDINGFDGYADEVGFSKAEELVATLGRSVLEIVRSHGSDFVGHLGGTDFIAVSPADVAEETATDAIANFEQKRSDWVGDAGSKLSLVIGVAPTEGLDADASDDMAKRMASALRDAKQREGSNHVVWKPETA
jgi:diguanylate cyclase (GGDEF)-like protein